MIKYDTYKMIEVSARNNSSSSGRATDRYITQILTGVSQHVQRASIIFNETASPPYRSIQTCSAIMVIGGATFWRRSRALYGNAASIRQALWPALPIWECLLFSKIIPFSSCFNKTQCILYKLYVAQWGPPKCSLWLEYYRASKPHWGWNGLLI